MNKIITILSLTLLSFMPAYAGVNIGASMNAGVFHGTGEENENGEKSREDATGAAAYASIFVEAGFGDVIAVGIEYVPSGIDSPTNTSRESESGTSTANDPGNSSVSASFEDLTTVYAKINVPLGGTYLKFGFSQVDVIINESMDSGNTYGDVNTEGYTAGIGYAHEIANGFSIRGEVMASQFDDVQTTNGVTTASVANGGKNVVQVESMWGAKGTVSLVKSF